MVKRMLDARASDFAAMSASELAQSIRETEGRTIAAEVIVHYEPPTEGVTHAEICAAFGADIITLHHFDADHPVINGLPGGAASYTAPISELKRLIGLPVAVNMAITGQAEGGGLYSRRYTPERLERLVEMGADIVFLYGDPLSGKTIEDVTEAVRSAKAGYGERLFLAGVPDVWLPAPVND